MIQYDINSNGFFFEVNASTGPFAKCAEELRRDNPDLIFEQEGKTFIETSAVIDIVLEAMESHVMTFPEGFSILSLLSQRYKDARKTALSRIHILYRSDTVA